MAVNESNGRTGWIIVKDVITYALIPLLVLGYQSIAHEIKTNALLLHVVESNQIRVMASVKQLQEDQAELTNRHNYQSTERARVHHTSAKSCLECKTMDRTESPRQRSNPFTVVK